MSRTWSSCAIETRCGGCGNKVKFGGPIQTITPHPERSMKKTFARCRLCADGEPPEDLAPARANRAEPIKPTGQPSLPLHTTEPR